MGVGVGVCVGVGVVSKLLAYNTMHAMSQDP